MGKTKPPPKATPPTGRVLRTNVAEWLFGLDRRRKLARVTRCEALCQEILAQPLTDPRRPYVARMQEFLAAARGNLERGHPADWQLVEIGALGNRMNRLVLEPLAARGAKFPPGGGHPRGKGPLWRAVTKVLRAEPPRLGWQEVMRAVVPLLPAARLGPDLRALAYGDGGEISQAAFKALVSEVRASLRT